MSDIIETIKKLRNLSATSNLGEATAAAIAANKLISKYRISEEQININSNEKPEQSTDILYESARSITWKANLASRLAKHYGCFIFNDIDFSDKGRKITRLRLVGLKSDMSLVSYMYNWLVFEIERLNKVNKGLGHIVANSFCLGAVNGVTLQLSASKEEEEKEAVLNNKSQALQKLDNRYSEAKAFITGIMKLKSDNKSSHSYLNSNAYSSGVKAGQSIHLGKVIGGANTKLLGS